MTTAEHAPSPGKPLVVLVVGSLAMAAAWVLTPQYGPWLCHGIFEPLSLFVAIKWGAIRVFTQPQSRWGFFALVLGVALAVGSWVLSPVAIRVIPGLGHEIVQLYATLGRPPGPARALPILVLTVLNEELIWRGVLVNWCGRRWSRSRTILVSTAAYALPVAMSGSVLLVGVAVVLGLILSGQRLVSRTWVAPFITHLVWTILVFVVRPLV